MKHIKIPKQLLALIDTSKKVLRHHYFIFTVLLLLGLAWVVYIVNQTLSAPSDEEYRLEKLNQTIKGNFDKATIDKIEALQKSSEQSTAPTPGPAGTRTNPFAE